MTELLARHAGLIVTLSNRYASSRHPSEDLDQESRLALLEAQRTRPDDDMTGGLASSIIRRRLQRVTQETRAAAGPPISVGPDLISWAVDQREHSAPAETVALRNIRDETIRAAVAALPAHLREVAVDKMLDLRTSETAARLGVSTRTVQLRWSAAAALLRPALEDA